MCFFYGRILVGAGGTPACSATACAGAAMPTVLPGGPSPCRSSPETARSSSASSGPSGPRTLYMSSSLYPVLSPE